MATRTKNAAATREALLCAARKRFVEDSYSDVGLRDVARDAGVDVAMVARYFGSKEELFREVLRGSQPQWLDPALTAEDLPAFLARMAVHADEEEAQENSNRLLLFLRSASSPTAEALVRDAFEEDVLKPMAGLLSGPDAYMRVSLAMAILCGVKVLRKVMSVHPLQECCGADLESHLRDLLKRALLD